VPGEGLAATAEGDGMSKAQEIVARGCELAQLQRPKTEEEMKIILRSARLMLRAMPADKSTTGDALAAEIWRKLGASRAK
jgi:hypothetical protein